MTPRLVDESRAEVRRRVMLYVLKREAAPLSAADLRAALRVADVTPLPALPTVERQLRLMARAGRVRETRITDERARIRAGGEFLFEII